MARSTLIESSEAVRQNLVADFAGCLGRYGAHIAVAMGGESRASDRIIMSHGGFFSTSRNMAVPLQPIGDRAQEFREELDEFHGERSGWILWNVFGDELWALDFSYKFSVCIMVRTHPPVGHPMPSELRISEVVTAEDVAIFDLVRATAIDHVPANVRRGDFFDERVLSANHRLWLGYVGDTPVATAALFDDAGLSMIKNVSTLPGFRRRGFGRAMSAHAANMARHTPMLDADPAAVPLYRSLGFDDVGRVDFWAPRSDDARP